MPRGVEGSYVEEHLPDDPDVLLEIGIEHFNARRFFQAHEAWEAAWHPSPEPERDFWQGITQVAVGCTHVQRGNPRGAQTLLRRGAGRLDGYGTLHRGIPVAMLAAQARTLADRLDTIEPQQLDEWPSIPPR